MGLIDLQAKYTGGNSGILELESYQRDLLKELFDNDERMAYELKDLGINVTKQNTADLYSFEEEIVVCPEPINFVHDYDDISDKKEQVRTRFLDAIKNDCKFERIRLHSQPTISVADESDLKVWRGKTVNGVNLRPGVSQTEDIQFAPVSLNDDNVHGLIVGRTGSGKSVYINALILSMITEYAPWELDLYLADFKKVELSRYMNDDIGTGIPFTPHVNACAATSEIRYVLSLFRYLVECMNARNEMFTRLGVTKIQEFRQTFNLVLPRVVLIVDEFQQMFNDATPREADEIQSLLNSITKLGRATGFHLIFASQEMSGTLRGNTLANFKVRMALPCNKDVSSEFLGNSAAADLERGYVLINTESGVEISNKKYRVPFIETEAKNNDDKGAFYLYLDQIKACSAIYRDELMYKANIQKFYQEDLQEKEGHFISITETEEGYLNDLWKIHEKKNQLIDGYDQYFDAVVLGKTVEFTNKKNDKVSFYIQYGRNRGIMIASPNPEDVARVRKLLTSNLMLANQKTLHIGVELNGLVYNRYQADKDIEKRPYAMTEIQGSQEYFGLQFEEAFQYLKDIFSLRKKSIQYLNSTKNDVHFSSAKDNLEHLQLLINDNEIFKFHQERHFNLCNLKSEIESIKTSIDDFKKRKKTVPVHPMLNYLEAVNSDLVTSPMEPKEEHLVNFIKLDIYNEIAKKCANSLTFDSELKDIVRQLDKEFEERKSNLSGMSDEQLNVAKVIIVRIKCLADAIKYFICKTDGGDETETKQAPVYEKAYALIKSEMGNYEAAVKAAVSSNEELSKLMDKKEVLERKIDLVKMSKDPIEEIENICRTHISRFIQSVWNSKSAVGIPDIVFNYKDGSIKWQFELNLVGNDDITIIYKKELDLLGRLYMKCVLNESVTVKDFDKCAFWLNGLDELDKIPVGLTEIIRECINYNILFIGMMTSELRDSSIRKAFDYAFVTGNVEKFYDMFNIKYTKQAIGTTNVNFGIQSQGINIPFKIYKSELDVVEVPNFINELLEDLI